MFDFNTIELKDVRDAIAKVKTSKNFGIDSIPTYFMEIAFPNI